MAKEILAKIARAEVVMMDEAHVLSLPPAVSVWAFASLKIPDKYKALGRVYQKWLDFCQSHVDLILELMERAGQGHAAQHLSRSIFNASFLEWRELKTAWSQLRKLAIAHGMPDDDILALRDIITILSTTQISIGYISENQGKGGGVYVSAGRVRQYRAINEFLTNHVSHTKHLFVSGTLFEPNPGYFSELAGKNVKNVIFPDLRGATEKLTLIPDRWTLGNTNFAEKLPVILETIKAIADREKQPIYLLAPSGNKAVWLKEEIANLGLKNICVDYYRSDLSLGVERTERVCITVGMAETPANACDALAHGKDSDERWLDSRRLRRQGVDAATWQAVNRVRDPDGKVESKVYFIGCRLERVLQAATWGTNRKLVVKDVSERKGSNGEVIKIPIFEVQVDQEIELPRVYGECKDKTNSERRSAKDFIEKIENYNQDIINSQNHCIFPTNIIDKENAVKLGIYNFPSNENEISSTTGTLYSMFVNRTDHYAQQFKNSKTEKWEFSKVKGELTEKRIRQHIAGEITAGVYQIALDDTVIWCCDDFDSHNGETDTREKVGKVIGVLRNYNIPFLLEASGSKDSYHLWIFLSRTSTYNAYRFIRQINSEAGVKTECWPKQKSLAKNSKFGNLVKLPVCYHNKSESRSAFLDADTFEPLEGPVTPPGLVHLLEIPDLSESDCNGMPKVSIRYEAETRSCSSNVLDYCMQRALDDKVSLQGSEGHHLRLAIAIKAQHIGLSAKEVAQLFRNQKDYDHDISLNKVLETWSYNYSPWSCETLRDKCVKLVTSYCPSCSLNHLDGVKSEA
ncbi:MAG TPA: hypothetical protein PKX20_00330 [Methanothrix soehngenii]|nr:hypothetical protein [Methanothrix soehngenii]